MSDHPDDLVLARLREIRGLLGEVKEDTASIKLRVGMLEAGYASMSLRLDRLDTRMDRIEVRLGLVDAP
jgi:hypothetical protein